MTVQNEVIKINLDELMELNEIASKLSAFITERYIELNNLVKQEYKKLEDAHDIEEPWTALSYDMPLRGVVYTAQDELSDLLTELIAAKNHLNQLTELPFLPEQFVREEEALKIACAHLIPDNYPDGTPPSVMIDSINEHLEFTTKAISK
jgi:hypothetical protein